MRLWHKDLIPVLPNKQLLGQWRECCCIARNIAINGTPNHLLVNKVMQYPYYEFCAYTSMVAAELAKRGYNIDFTRFAKYGYDAPEANATYELGHIFAGWHNDRYLLQCVINLQEKYDCGGITENEWRAIYRIWCMVEQKNYIERMAHHG